MVFKWHLIKSRTIYMVNILMGLKYGTIKKVNITRVKATITAGYCMAHISTPPSKGWAKLSRELNPFFFGGKFMLTFRIFINARGGFSNKFITEWKMKWYTFWRFNMIQSYHLHYPCLVLDTLDMLWWKFLWKKVMAQSLAISTRSPHPWFLVIKCQGHVPLVSCKMNRSNWLYK